MFTDKVFRITFIISLVTHAIVFLQNQNLSLFSKNKQEPVIEVTYLKTSSPKEEQLKAVNHKVEPLYKLPPKISLDKEAKEPLQNKNNMDDIFKKAAVNLHQQSPFVKPNLIKPDTIAIKKKITLPSLEMDKINNPTYVSYYQLVREKIRRAAYHNYIRTDTGEVYISFVITNSGSLKEIRLHEDKSSTIEFLKQTALVSIKDASPFPPFPKELDYPQLSFNVIISFEIE